MGVTDPKTKVEGFADPSCLQQPDRILKWFEFEHLPPHLQAIIGPFCVLAHSIVEIIDGGPERTVALRKLLEAKDAAVRAVVHPGG